MTQITWRSFIHQGCYGCYGCLSPLYHRGKRRVIKGECVIEEVKE